MDDGWNGKFKSLILAQWDTEIIQNLHDEPSNCFNSPRHSLQRMVNVLIKIYLPTESKGEYPISGA